MNSADLHDHVRELLLEGRSTTGYERHIENCPSCESLAARLAAIDRLLTEAPLPRPALLGEILERTSRRGAGRAGARQNVIRARPSVHVLLVEDDPAVVEMYRVRLEMDGYRVLTTTGGPKTVNLIRDVMPQVVVLCGGDELGIRTEARRLGVLGWLLEDQLTPAELSAVVRGLLNPASVGDGPGATPIEADGRTAPHRGPPARGRPRR